MLLSRNLGTLSSCKPLGQSRTVMGLLYLCLYTRGSNCSADKLQLKSDVNRFADLSYKQPLVLSLFEKYDYMKDCRYKASFNTSHFILSVFYACLTFSRLMTYIYIYIYKYIYIYMSYRTANLQMLHFIYLFNKYTY